MLTQIFIKPQDSGCQPEYTKIASHSFGFQGDFTLGNQNVEALYFAGDYDPATGTDYPVWSATKYDFAENYIAGSLKLRDSEKTAGIALPINLVADDKITLSGTAYYQYYGDWIESGFTSVTLIVGVYYFNCSDAKEKLQLYTFIPVTLTDFDEFGTACFSTEVTLGSNFDIHETRLVIGYNTYVTGDSVTPGSPTILTVSHTLDIERACKAEVTNFIIKNCCEPSITELVNIPGLVVGNFHVDDEGNCWEVMEASNDVTNFTRTFTDIYTTCLECQDANPCPLNLKISSCCVVGQEFVTGSLPGLNVGDTFVDNYGLCWTVEDETGGPISEESITVASIITGNCDTCKTENPCPYFYFVQSCCASIGGVIALPDLLNEGDAFVDTTGICWTVTKVNQNELPTMYGIVVDTVYPVGESNTCDDCTLANPCPTEYFITIKSCCDPQRVEVASVPANSMIFSEGTIFQDVWNICWEVISFSTTGVETYPIWDWVGSETKPTFNLYKNCRDCARSTNGCLTMYQLKRCGTDAIDIFNVYGDLTIGAFYQLEKSGTLVCYEVLGYGYPAFNTNYGILTPGDAPSYGSCNECIFTLDTVVKNVIWEYCDTPGVTYIAQTTFSGAYSYGLVTTTPDGTRDTCIQLLSVTTDPTNSTLDSGASLYIDCPTCAADY